MAFHEIPAKPGRLPAFAANAVTGALQVNGKGRLKLVIRLGGDIAREAGFGDGFPLVFGFGDGDDEGRVRLLRLSLRDATRRKGSDLPTCRARLEGTALTVATSRLPAWLGEAPRAARRLDFALAEGGLVLDWSAAGARAVAAE